MARIEIGKYLLSDSRVSGGRLIFKGTRIAVSDVLELSSAGYAPNAIAREYHHAIKAAAVREALSLTRRGVVKEIRTRRVSAA